MCQMPTATVNATVAADRNLTLSAEQLAAARAVRATFSQELEQLRSVQLTFLPPYIKPQTAARLIENGGRSK
jgi:hypothetical protein